MEFYKLNNAVHIPALGLGVWRAFGDESYNAVRIASDTGYRLIDTAALYENEAYVGRAVRDSGIPREEFFVTSKIWPSMMTRGKTRESFTRSLSELGFDYLDLFLLHWPMGSVAESWSVLEELYGEGKVRAIGVSNFMPAHLDELLKTAKIVPALNQIESNPYYQQAEAIEHSRSLGIMPQSWGPLGRGNVFSDKAVTEICRKHGRTPAQVVLRWHHQRGVAVIPKSVHAERIRENFDIFGFELDSSDMSAIDALDRGVSDRVPPAGFDPLRFGALKKL